MQFTDHNNKASELQVNESNGGDDRFWLASEISKHMIQNSQNSGKWNWFIST